jgi:DNA-binding response OmpR family regulator
MSEPKKPRILVVEDDPDLRTILSLQLRTEGFEVLMAEDGAAGFELAKFDRPDVIVLDLMMPVMDGFSVLKRLRSVDSLMGIPVLILTASEDDRHRRRGSIYQADAYMNKPYNLQKLTEVIRKLVAQGSRVLSR